MVPALEPGDRLWVDRRAYDRALPRLGDIVVLTDPEDRDRWLVKRVAALPGMPTPGMVTPGDPALVPAEHVFVLSDAPEGSRDSRRFGPVPARSVLGEAWFRYAPPGRVGPLGP